MGQRTETVPALLDGERLDRVVAMVTGLSRSAVVGVVEGGGVTVGGRPATKVSARLREGQVLEVVWEDGDGGAELVPDPSVEFTVVHADDDVIVLDKPPGLVVHPGSGNAERTLVHGLLARFPEIADVGDDPERPGIVHRLDKGTSGLLVVARSPEAYESLVAQLSARSVERRYEALVWGRVEAPGGVVDGPIGRAPNDPTRMAIVVDGKPARTRYEVEQRYESPVEVTAVWCRLETGRTHQIRVHLAAIGHPVVGDERYGGARSTLACPRPYLHAGVLGFTHPGTGNLVRFEAALPADLEAVRAGLA